MSVTLPVKINHRKVEKNQTEKASLGERTMFGRMKSKEILFRQKRRIILIITNNDSGNNDDEDNNNNNNNNNHHHHHNDNNNGS